MPNVSEKKKKLLCIAEILLKETDEEHAITLPELLQRLADLGIPAERKSVYDDLETLRSMGMHIGTKKEKSFKYYLQERLFSLEELYLLGAEVRSSRALSKEQADTLLHKLEALCSVHQAAWLRQALSEKKQEKDGEKVTLEFSAAYLEQMESWFGPDFAAEPSGKNRMRAVLKVKVGPRFFAWLFAQGTEVKIIAPKKLAEQFREKAKAAAKQYKS